MKRSFYLHQRDPENVIFSFSKKIALKNFWGREIECVFECYRINRCATKKVKPNRGTTVHDFYKNPFVKNKTF